MLKARFEIRGNLTWNKQILKQTENIRRDFFMSSTSMDRYSQWKKSLNFCFGKNTMNIPWFIVRVFALEHCDHPIENDENGCWGIFRWWSNGKWMNEGAIFHENDVLILWLYFQTIPQFWSNTDAVLEQTWVKQTIASFPGFDALSIWESWDDISGQWAPLSEVPGWVAGRGHFSQTAVVKWLREAGHRNRGVSVRSFWMFYLERISDLGCFQNFQIGCFPHFLDVLLLWKRNAMAASVSSHAVEFGVF